MPLEAVHYEEPVNPGDITKASLFVIQDGVAHFRGVETGTIRGARAVSDVA